MSEPSPPVLVGVPVNIFDVASVSRRQRPTALDERAVAALTKTRTQLEAALADAKRGARYERVCKELEAKRAALKRDAVPALSGR